MKGRKRTAKEQTLICVAVLAYILGCCALFIIKYQVYGGAVETRFFLALILPLLIALVYQISWSERVKLEQNVVRRIQVLYKAEKIVSLVFYILCGSVIAYSFFFEKYQVATTELAVICLTGSVFVAVWQFRKGRRPKNFTAWFVIVSYLALALTAYFAPLRLGIQTEKAAAEKVRQAGYEDVSYLRAYPVRELTEEEIPLTEAEQKLNLYLYEGRRDGAYWKIYVSPATGRILHEENPSG